MFVPTRRFTKVEVRSLSARQPAPDGASTWMDISEIEIPPRIRSLILENRAEAIEKRGQRFTRFVAAPPLKRRQDDDNGEGDGEFTEEEIARVSDPDSEDYDPDDPAFDPDWKEKNSRADVKCLCACPECKDGDCANCSNAKCNDEKCLMARMKAQLAALKSAYLGPWRKNGGPDIS